MYNENESHKLCCQNQPDDGPQSQVHSTYARVREVKRNHFLSTLSHAFCNILEKTILDT